MDIDSDVTIDEDMFGPQEHSIRDMDEPRDKSDRVRKSQVIQKPNKKPKLEKMKEYDREEGLVMRMSCLSTGIPKRLGDNDNIIDSVTCDEISFVSMEAISGNHDEKDGSCFIDGNRYKGFNNRTFYCDTGTSFNLDKDTIGLYNAEEIYEDIGGIGDGGQLIATWKGKKYYKVIPVSGESWVIRGVDVKVVEKAELRLFGGHLEHKARGGKLSTTSTGNWY